MEKQHFDSQEYFSNLKGGFLYAFAALSTGVFAFCVAIGNSYINVEFMRCVDEKYLARVDAILTALSISATPIAS